MPIKNRIAAFEKVYGHIFSGVIYCSVETPKVSKCS